MQPYVHPSHMPSGRTQGQIYVIWNTSKSSNNVQSNKLLRGERVRWVSCVPKLIYEDSGQHNLQIEAASVFFFFNAIRSDAAALDIKHDEGSAPTVPQTCIKMYVQRFHYTSAGLSRPAGFYNSVGSRWCRQGTPRPRGAGGLKTYFILKFFAGSFQLTPILLPAASILNHCCESYNTYLLHGAESFLRS